MSYIEFVLPFALFLALVSLIRLWRQPRQRPWMLTVSIATLFLLSSNLIAAFLSMLLERRYDGREFVDTADAIVVLGGGIEPADANRPVPALGQDTYARCLHAASLYRSRPSRPVVVTGKDCAVPMAHYLEMEGVAADLIWHENRARNTHENAVYSAALLREKGIHTVALVTDAKSMMRAEQCFRAERLDVIPSPEGLGVMKWSPLLLIPSWKAIRSNGDALHEILGMFWYRWKGWI